MKSKKIGIMGGTFDPIHNGHLLLGTCAYEEFHLDSVWFMPTATSYLKNGSGVTDSITRAHMVSLAIQDIPYFTMSDMEIQRGGDTYTADTVQELGQLYPQDHFHFIMGEDAFTAMDTWKRFEEIFKHVTILVGCRNPQVSVQLRDKIKDFSTSYQANVHLLSFPFTDISATDIRKLSRNGNDMEKCLPPLVAKYIKEHGLYLSLYA